MFKCKNNIAMLLPHGQKSNSMSDIGKACTKTAKESYGHASRQALCRTNQSKVQNTLTTGVGD
jgi:hypothetical protein